jgi:hypothetical protein
VPEVLGCFIGSRAKRLKLKGINTMKIDYCFIAIEEGAPGAYAMCADMPEFEDDGRDFVMEELRNGATIKRLKVEDARGLLGQWIEFDQKRKAAA